MRASDARSATENAFARSVLPERLKAKWAPLTWKQCAEEYWKRSRLMRCGLENWSNLLMSSVHTDKFRGNADRRNYSLLVELIQFQKSPNLIEVNSVSGMRNVSVRA